MKKIYTYQKPKIGSKEHNHIVYNYTQWKNISKCLVVAQQVTIKMLFLILSLFSVLNMLLLSQK